MGKLRNQLATYTRRKFAPYARAWVPLPSELPSRTPLTSSIYHVRLAVAEAQVTELSVGDCD